ncbi:hypothetical protein [Vibrio sp. 1180_3]|uniref:hypothetical protein n=1 Tax=Vibrio sp. 1180_3 TaxID=2528832 RepID=UPI002405155C|nr:hypothetical protein [Vibrio sp. 1180_3]MDF9399121.1 hypothetical protein [Vibrio sp. 1180_3]
MKLNLLLILGGMTASTLTHASLDVGLEKITEVSQSIDIASSLGEWKDMAQSVMGLTQQGANGKASTPKLETQDGSMNSLQGGIADNLKQRDAWNLGDEYSYAFENDYGDLGTLMDCMEYSVVGSCLSVRWTMFGPKYTFALAVEHFVRDVHAEVIPQAPTEDITNVPSNTVLPSSNDTESDVAMMYPYMWKINRALGSSLLTDAISSVLEDAEGQTVPTKKTRYLYSDVQVSGNIERQFFDAIGGSLIGLVGYCKSPTIPALTYFNSSLDQFSWRWLATSEVILMGLYQSKYLEWNDIGRGYGSTMPRTGYVESVDRFRTSVVSAIRGTNIAAENRATFSGLAGLHIFNPLPQYASSSFTGPQYQTPQDAKSFKLDMVYPYKGERCTRYNANEAWYKGALSHQALIEEDELTAKFSEQNGNKAAIFKIYRPFRCCRKNGNKVFDVVSPGSIGRPK